MFFTISPCAQGSIPVEGTNHSFYVCKKYDTVEALLEKLKGYWFDDISCQDTTDNPDKRQYMEEIAEKVTNCEDGALFAFKRLAMNYGCCHLALFVTNNNDLIMKQDDQSSMKQWGYDYVMIDSTKMSECFEELLKD